MDSRLSRVRIYQTPPVCLLTLFYFLVDTLPCQLKDGSGSAPQVTAFTSALLKPNSPADSSISLFQKQISIFESS